MLSEIDGVEVKSSSPTFNEFTVRLPVDAGRVVEAMIAKGIAAGFPLGRYYEGMENFMIVAVTEKRTREESEEYVRCLKDVLKEINEEGV